MTKRNHLDNFPPHIVEAALKRQMGRCALCGRKLTGKLPEGVGMAAHHLLRVADNGATHIDNCVVLWYCVPTNCIRKPKIVILKPMVIITNYNL